MLATWLASEGARATALDASARMIDLARRRASAANVELHLVEGSADDLPFSDESFDVVVSIATLCFSADPERSVREMAREWIGVGSRR